MENQVHQEKGPHMLRNTQNDSGHCQPACRIPPPPEPFLACFARTRDMPPKHSRQHPPCNPRPPAPPPPPPRAAYNPPPNPSLLASLAQETSHSNIALDSLVRTVGPKTAHFKACMG